MKSRKYGQGGELGETTFSAAAYAYVVLKQLWNSMFWSFL